MLSFLTRTISAQLDAEQNLSQSIPEEFLTKAERPIPSSGITLAFAEAPGISPCIAYLKIEHAN